MMAVFLLRIKCINLLFNCSIIQAQAFHYLSWGSDFLGVFDVLSLVLMFTPLCSLGKTKCTLGDWYVSYWPTQHWLDRLYVINIFIFQANPG